LQIGATSGWGVYGCQLALRLASRGIPLVPVGPCEWNSLHPAHRAALAGTQAIQQQFERDLNQRLQGGGRPHFNFEGDVLFCLANDLVGPELPFTIRGTRNIGTVFLEDPRLSPQAVAGGKTFHKIIAGSTWNGQVLRKYALDNVAVVLQGIDPQWFGPGARQGKWKDHFVIFSGGKLEYRKGQDLVVAATRAFARRHPQTLLVFAWNNPWPQSMNEIDRAGLVEGTPQAHSDGRIDFAGWLARNGVEHFVDLGLPLNWQMPELIREADVALFPNRAEGGTNLVAMECMACGVPTILSANTGHLDIISDEICYQLHNQGPVRATPWYPSVEGWGESSVEEMEEALERVYADRAQAALRGAAAAAAMRRFSWENQIDQQLREINQA
jgi:glycosyltransferase involved in cell wall biosynthesis